MFKYSHDFTGTAIGEAHRNDEGELETHIFNPKLNEDRQVSIITNGNDRTLSTTHHSLSDYRQANGRLADGALAP